MGQIGSLEGFSVYDLLKLQFTINIFLVIDIAVLLCIDWNGKIKINKHNVCLCTYYSSYCNKYQNESHWWDDALPIKLLKSDKLIDISPLQSNKTVVVLRTKMYILAIEHF